MEGESGRLGASKVGYSSAPGRLVIAWYSEEVWTRWGRGGRRVPGVAYPALSCIRTQLEDALCRTVVCASDIVPLNRVERCTSQYSNRSGPQRVGLHASGGCGNLGTKACKHCQVERLPY